MDKRIEEIYAGLAEEHDELMALVTRLEAHDTLDSLVPLLAKLHGSLIHHFGREQFPNGLYECLGVNRPEYHEDLKVLIKEHCVILSSAAALLECVRLADLNSGPELLDDVKRLTRQIREHESKEHALTTKVTRDQSVDRGRASLPVNQD